jgi:Putative transposase
LIATSVVSLLLVSYCARPALSGERLGRLNADTLVYRLRKPTVDGRMEIVLTPLELLDRLSKLITPPRIHKHRYCGVLAPNAKLRRAVIESAGPAGATLQLLTAAREQMGMGEGGEEAASSNPLRRAAARCWALLLVRIYECLPLLCPSCGQPMRIIAFLEDPQVVEKILLYLGEPTKAPQVLPARAPPQAELDFDQVPSVEQGESEWPEMDQTVDATDDTWD